MDTIENASPDRTEARTRLWDLIKDIRFAMFTTRHGNGHLHSRPMTTQNSRLDEDSSLWFFMDRRDDPVADLKADPVVNLVYADPGKDRYVSVSGTATVVEDLAKNEAVMVQAQRSLLSRRPCRPQPRACRSPDHPRQLLGRDRKQDRAVVQNGQGRDDRHTTCQAG